MPLPMVHLSVARKIINTGFSIKHVSRFYLGSISPDSIHMRQNTDRHAKDNSHLISTGETLKDVDLNEHFKSTVDFINENMSKADTDFLWGYGVHILTDILWNKRIYQKFVEDYNKDIAPIQDEREAYYNDTDIVDQALFNECGWKEEVWRYLQGVEYFDFLDLLTAQEIKLWNERTIHWFDSGESQHKNPIKYITKSDIESFILSCSETIWNEIAEKNYCKQTQ